MTPCFDPLELVARFKARGQISLAPVRRPWTQPHSQAEMFRQAAGKLTGQFTPRAVLASLGMEPTPINVHRVRNVLVRMCKAGRLRMVQRGAGRSGVSIFEHGH